MTEPLKLKMTVEDALKIVDAWTRGMTIHEASTGPRIAALLLAEEVRRLRGEQHAEAAE